MKRTQSKSTAKNLIAGGIAGGLEAMVMYPVEFSKTQLQLHATKYTSLKHVFQSTIRHHGVRGLYRGLSVLVCGCTPKAAVRFAAFNSANYTLPDMFTGLYRVAFSGMIAGCIEAVIASTPMESVKTRFIHDQTRRKPRYTGLIHGVSRIIKEEGFLTIYRGVMPTMIRQGSNQMIRFTVFNGCKNWYLSRNRNRLYNDLYLFETLAFGACAGFVSCIITMPIDVIKTQMQGLNSREYSSMYDCALKIVSKSNRGILSLWSGTLPRLIRVSCSGGLIFMFYEQTMKIMNSTFWPE